MNGTTADFFILIVFCVLLVGITDALVHRIRGRRYSGRVFDPREAAARADVRTRHVGAERVGITGHVCHFCDAVTFGLSSRCGRCGRLPVALPSVPVESSAFPRES